MTDRRRKRQATYHGLIYIRYQIIIAIRFSQFGIKFLRNVKCGGKLIINKIQGRVTGK